MSRMGTQATAARRPAATGLLQLSIMSILSLIIEQISERDIFEFVLLSRSVWFRYEAKRSGTASHNHIKKLCDFQTEVVVLIHYCYVLIDVRYSTFDEE